MIYSSLNLLLRIFVRLLRVGIYRKSVTFQGRTSAIKLITQAARHHPYALTENNFHF